MPAPMLITDSAVEVYLADSVSSLIQNVGSNPLYIATYDGCSDINYEYLLNAGATVEWNGYTRIYAVAGPNASSALLTFKNSQFNFDGYSVGRNVSEQAYRTAYPDVFEMDPVPNDTLVTSQQISFQIPRGIKTLECNLIPDTNFATANEFAKVDYLFQFLDTGSMRVLNSDLIAQGKSPHPAYPSMGNLQAFRLRGSGITAGYTVVGPAISVPATGPWCILTIQRSDVVVDPTKKIKFFDEETILDGLTFSNKEVAWPWAIQDFFEAWLLPNVNTSQQPQLSYFGFDSMSWFLNAVSSANTIPIPYRYGFDIEVAFSLTHTTLATVAPTMRLRHEPSDGSVNSPAISDILPITLAAGSTTTGMLRATHPPYPIEIQLQNGTGAGTFTGTIDVKYKRNYG